MGHHLIITMGLRFETQRLQTDGLRRYGVGMRKLGRVTVRSGGYGDMCCGSHDPWNPVQLGANGHRSPASRKPSDSRATTQHTFAHLHSIVRSVSAVAQLLESGSMAKRGSFFTTSETVEQLGQLRNVSGGALGLVDPEDDTAPGDAEFSLTATGDVRCSLMANPSS
ncbi:Peroxisomal membrane protein PAS20 [Marasmius crinis-equi]|uniref:Peroxisomal membrane protein PAS20 n=1 Tax=Marasmius crinis-equi TaxID=585013 RepID=A0ABR3EMD0_9AGAR